MAIAVLEDGALHLVRQGGGFISSDATVACSVSVGVTAFGKFYLVNTYDLGNKFTSFQNILLNGLLEVLAQAVCVVEHLFAKFLVWRLLVRAPD